MPEGDSVRQAADLLQAALAGERLIRWDLRVPRYATTDLTGRLVLEVTPRGKHLLTRIEGGLTLHSHLGMEGSWRIHRPGDRLSGGPVHQIRAVLANENRAAVGYRLPVLELIRTDREDEAVGHLGPDLLGSDWDPDTARANLARSAEVPLGEALLDQRNLAGIGNIYKSEICFLTGVTPWLPVGALGAAALDRVPAVAKELLESNRITPLRNTTGLRESRHFVYGRAPRPCLRCRTPVRAAPQGEPGRERPTYWCPRCQTGPAPGTAASRQRP